MDQIHPQMLANNLMQNIMPMVQCIKLFIVVIINHIIDLDQCILLQQLVKLDYNWLQYKPKNHILLYRRHIKNNRIVLDHIRNQDHLDRMHPLIYITLSHQHLVQILQFHLMLEQILPLVRQFQEKIQLNNQFLKLFMYHLVHLPFLQLCLLAYNQYNHHSLHLRHVYNYHNPLHLQLQVIPLFQVEVYQYLMEQ